jgi:hypothetical protein
MTLNNPSLELTFTVNDVQHGTSQTIGYDYIVNRSVTLKRQLLNGLKSSSDTLSLEITRNCISTEDIIATEGDIAVVLKDGNATIFTGYISTNFAWTVGQTGEQLLRLTLETVGTRLLAQPYITTGRVFFDDNASSIIYNVCSKAGVTIASGHDRVLLQNVSYVVEADTTCKDILDQLFYECNACYYFDEYGHLCVYQINPSTVGAPTIDGDDLYVVSNRAVTLNKKLRQYKGARIQYWVHGTASDYLVYRNTTDGDSDNHCNLTLESGEYFDGTEIYTSQEWSDAQLDSFREPAYIGAVNASSESSIVGSNKIVSISNLTPVVQNTGTMTATFEAVGGEYFKLTAHNPGGSSAKFTQLDLKADIVYEKSIGVIRTNMTGTAVNKATLEEEMSWIHDKDNAQLHANMVSQYHQYSGSTYSFNTDKAIALGSVVRINDNVHTGLDVYVLVTGCTETYSDIINYTGVGVSTFNLNEDAFYQTVEEGKQSGAAGPQGSAGESVEVQYALGTSLTDPPTSEMQWGGADMLWNGDEMEWDSVAYSDSVPTLVRGYYIWMRQRVGDSAWQYSRMTGTTVWDAENLGVCTSATPTQSREGLGLVAGDYFVAGATFTENGTTYNSGYAYTYNGSRWVEMDLTNSDNAKKALDLFGSLTSGGTQIASSNSSASMWTWAKNLVAQNAVIENLFSQNITVLDNGSIHSDYYNDDGTVNPSSSATNGFWLGADGTMKCYSATAESLNITGDSTFHGQLTTDSLSSAIYGTTIYACTGSNSSTQAKDICDALIANNLISNYSSTGQTTSYIRCSITGASDIKYIKLNYATNWVRIFFYGSDYSPLDFRDYFTAVYSNTEGNLFWNSYGRYCYISGGVTISCEFGGSTINLTIPDQSAYDSNQLSSGDVYYNSLWLKMKIQSNGTVEKSWVAAPNEIASSGKLINYIPPGHLWKA